LPTTSKCAVIDPRRPILIMSPISVREVGSPTMQASMRSPVFHPVENGDGAVAPGAFLVARDGDDDRPVGRRVRRTRSTAAATKAATPDFMSVAPRP
jgi:hypothetical protein